MQIKSNLTKLLLASSLTLAAGQASAQLISLIETSGKSCAVGASQTAPTDASVATWGDAGTLPHCVPSGQVLSLGYPGASPFNPAAPTEGSNVALLRQFATSTVVGQADQINSDAFILKPGWDYCVKIDAQQACDTGTGANYGRDGYHTCQDSGLTIEAAGSTATFAMTDGAPMATFEMSFTATSISNNVAFSTVGVPGLSLTPASPLYRSNMAAIYVDNARVEVGACEPPVEPTDNPSSGLQSTAAVQTMRYTREHIASRLGTSGQEHDNYLLQFNFENEDRSINNGGRWTVLAASSSDLTGDLQGDGTFISTLAGWDMSEGEDSLWGYIVGAEYGDWTFVTEGAAEKIGLSAGVYAGRRLGENGLIEGHLTYTRFLNNFTNSAGATADVQSDRMIAHVSLSGKIGEAGRTTITPFLEADYAVESMPAYTIGGQNIAATTVEVGLISLGAELTTAWNPQRGQFFARLQADQAFGQTPMTLSDGTVVNPYEDITATAGIGWISNTSYDSIGRFELSVSDIGNDDRMDARLEGHWERNF